MDAAAQKRSLPIGIQTFRKLREGGSYYVDKTGFAVQLAREGTHYFLSRPRRFGKSLFLDTLKELFLGNRQLFQGLEADRSWDWSVRHPVVRLEFGSVNVSARGDLDADLTEQVRAIEDAEGVNRLDDTARGRFRHLIRSLHQKRGQRVVVLVDEYDKPILDALCDPSIARANRDYLRGLYSVIKSCDAHVRFCFLTGVSNFSKASLFSGLNNLVDITLEPAFSAVCGYTENDLDTVFAPELQGLERERIREWYNGYSWGGTERVYNPFDVLLLFRKRRFGAWWFETGSPAFLVDSLVARGVDTASLHGMRATDELLSAFDVDTMSTEALLFQTGHLTLLDSGEEEGEWIYRLGYPNREVRQSLNRTLLGALLPDGAPDVKATSLIRRQLRTADVSGIETSLRGLLAGIPADWHRRNKIAKYEGYYATVLYSFFTGLGLDVKVEDASNAGRLDMAVRAYGRVYLLEFKVQEQAGVGSAMAQLKDRGYADKYRHLDETVHLLGMEFSSKERNLVRFDVELA